MNDASFFVGVGFVLALAMYVFGPTHREVPATHWDKAVETCQFNEGVKAVEIATVYSSFEVICKNGAVFNLSTENE